MEQSYTIRSILGWTVAIKHLFTNSKVNGTVSRLFAHDSTPVVHTRTFCTGNGARSLLHTEQ